MPKQLINTIGTLIVIAIVAIAVAFIAVPLLIQAQAVDQQSQAVASANDVQQVAVDALAAQQSELPELAGDLDQLQAQIPASPRIDTVSQLVTDAAAATGVRISAITPGEPVAFGTSPDGSAGAAPVGAPEGAQQIPISINVSGTTTTQVLDFVDALRAGPRLLGNISLSMQSGVDGTAASVSALAFSTPSRGEQ